MGTIKTYEQDASAMGRINAWWTAYELAKVRVTGGGFETFMREKTFIQYAPDPRDVHDVHSIYFEVMGEHGFIGFTMFMLLAWFTWNTGNRIRRQAGGSEETRWGADLASMLQVSMLGYAAAGAFLGLAYFDLYYDVIAMMVLCSMLIKKQIIEMETATNSREPEFTVAAEQPDSQNRSLRRRC
jgi:probable O-glycosylation ligase (exosortase A-associated)